MASLISWPSKFQAEAIFEDDTVVNFGSEVDTYPVHLGPPITRLALPKTTEFTGSINMLSRSERDELYKFWQEAQTNVFEFPHPIFGDQLARFHRGGGLQFVHKGAGYYEATISLEILDEAAQYPRPAARIRFLSTKGGNQLITKGGDNLVVG